MQSVISPLLVAHRTPSRVGENRLVSPGKRREEEQQETRTIPTTCKSTPWMVTCRHSIHQAHYGGYGDE